MDSIAQIEKDYGYIIAAVVCVIAAVMIKYGYDDVAAKGENYTRGVIMIVVAVMIAALSIYGAYTYA